MISDSPEQTPLVRLWRDGLWEVHLKSVGRAEVHGCNCAILPVDGSRVLGESPRCCRAPPRLRRTDPRFSRQAAPKTCETKATEKLNHVTGLYEAFPLASAVHSPKYCAEGNFEVLLLKYLFNYDTSFLHFTTPQREVTSYSTKLTTTAAVTMQIIFYVQIIWSAYMLHLYRLTFSKNIGLSGNIKMLFNTLKSGQCA